MRTTEPTQGLAVIPEALMNLAEEPHGLPSRRVDFEREFEMMLGFPKLPFCPPGQKPSPSALNDDAMLSQLPTYCTVPVVKLDVRLGYLTHAD